MSTVNFNDTTPAAPNANAINVQFQSDASGNISANYTPGVWTDWIPTLGAAGSMTVSGVLITSARYLRLGPTCLFYMEVAGTLGGTASNLVTISLPLNSTAPSTPGVYGQSSQNGWANLLTAVATSVINVQLQGITNFSLGFTQFRISGFYQCG